MRLEGMKKGENPRTGHTRSCGHAHDELRWECVVNVLERQSKCAFTTILFVNVMCFEVET